VAHVLDGDAAAVGGAARADGADDLAARVYGGYFGLQAVGGTLFWVLMAAVPAVERLFTMSPREHAVTGSYLFADLIVGIAGSALAAVGLHRRRPWAPAVALFVAGGMVYATLYLVGWVAGTGHGAALLALMVVPSTLSAWAAAQAWKLPRPR
jgi:hypothetical protein